MIVPSVVEVVPMTGTGTDAVMAAVRKILGRGDVISLTVKASDSAVHFERLATTEEAAAKASLTYHDIVRARPMEEYVPADAKVGAHQQLFEMFEVLEDAGFVPALLLSGRPVARLREWLPTMSRKAKTIFGVRVQADETIPEDNLILCGTDGTDEGPESVRFSVKVTLP